MTALDRCHSTISETNCIFFKENCFDTTKTHLGNWPWVVNQTLIVVFYAISGPECVVNGCAIILYNFLLYLLYIIDKCLIWYKHQTNLDIIRLPLFYGLTWNSRSHKHEQPLWMSLFCLFASWYTVSLLLLLPALNNCRVASDYSHREAHVTSLYYLKVIHGIVVMS